jgi:NAD+--dinitrogen-reductase ADP-D-ribosyltransferase
MTDLRPEFCCADRRRPNRFGHSTNLFGVPTGWLGSLGFNDEPVALHLTGVRSTSNSLFRMLEESDGPEDAALAFETYMVALYGLDPEQRSRRVEEGPRRYRSSYYRLLRGWGYDSNSPEGAVLKGWVESRFGLFPTFHKEALNTLLDEPWMAYVCEKMSSRFHNNAILSQLDLLYEFAQWSLSHYFAVGQRHLTLYRGVNDFKEHQVIERLDRRTVVMRLNNLMSFSSDRDAAGCFGDTILTADVPLAKILFFNTLLPRHGLKGEGEFLVIGGTYRVQATYL